MDRREFLKAEYDDQGNKIICEVCKAVMGPCFCEPDWDEVSSDR